VTEVSVTDLSMDVRHFRHAIHSRLADAYGLVMYNWDIGVTDARSKTRGTELSDCFLGSDWSANDLSLLELVRYLDKIPPLVEPLTPSPRRWCFSPLELMLGAS
jgi:hypothetical protein